LSVRKVSDSQSDTPCSGTVTTQTIYEIRMYAHIPINIVMMRAARDT